MNASNPRAYRRAALLTLLLAAVLAVVTCAVGLTRVQVPQNRFTTGTVAIDLNGGKPILTEDEYLFEPGMTVNKDFTLSNTGTADVYYKCSISCDVSRELADVLEVTRFRRQRRFVHRHAVRADPQHRRHGPRCAGRGPGQDPASVVPLPGKHRATPPSRPA